jgi:hypothetical protein
MYGREEKCVDFGGEIWPYEGTWKIWGRWEDNTKMDSK